MTTRRATQTLVEAEYLADTAYRRITQTLVEAEYLADTAYRRATQFIVEIEYASIVEGGGDPVMGLVLFGSPIPV